MYTRWHQNKYLQKVLSKSTHTVLTLTDAPGTLEVAGPEVIITETPALPSEILGLLGEPAPEPSIGDVVHHEVAARWEKILTKGLDSETKKSLISNYPPLANCSAATPPKLNLEVRNAITETALHRDERLAVKQTQMSACLSALGKILNLSLESPDIQESKHALLQAVGDAARLTSDLFFEESQSRRILLGSHLNSKCKSVVNETPTDEWLFGANLGDRLKNAKSMEKSALDLKKALPAQKNQPPKNFKRPSSFARTPRAVPRTDGRPSAQHQSNQQGHRQRSTQRQGSSSKAHHWKQSPSQKSRPWQ